MGPVSAKNKKTKKTKQTIMNLYLNDLCVYIGVPNIQNLKPKSDKGTAAEQNL